MDNITLIRCPLCNELTDKHEFDFWKCPNCGCEVWPEEENSEKEEAKAIREVYYNDIRIPLIKKRSGGRSSRRYNKKKVAPPLWVERYMIY